MQDIVVASFSRKMYDLTVVGCIIFHGYLTSPCLASFSKVTVCKFKSWRIDSFGQRCGMLPKTKEKSDNRLVDRAMLENGLLF